MNAVLEAAASCDGEGCPTGPVIALGGEKLLLLPQRAALLPERAILLVADAHFGKALSFRRLGVPVPHGTTGETLTRLGLVVRRFGVRRIVFLGDLLHSRHAHAPASRAALAAWRGAHVDLELTLVRGNHDRHAGDPPAALGIEVVDEPFAIGGLALGHHPSPLTGRYLLAGHIHPCVTLGGAARDYLRLPCFHFGPTVGVLPAFGAFTGMQPVRAAPGDRLYAVADERIVAIRSRLHASP